MLASTFIDEVGTLVPVVTAIVAIATVYLRSFVKNELGDLKEQIHIHLDRKYLGRDVIDLRLQSIERRLDNIEGSSECGILKNHKNI